MQGWAVVLLVALFDGADRLLGPGGAPDPREQRKTGLRY